MSIEAKLAAANIVLPPAPAPAGVYQPVIVVGNIAYVSGHGPLRADGTMITGRVGADINQHDAYEAARQTGLAMLSSLRGSLGSLDRIERLVKTLGMVNCVPEFTAHPAVINGFSDLFKELLGPDLGVGARSAVGMGSLPGNISVEVEAIFLLKS